MRGDMSDDAWAATVEHGCQLMHDAYERAAAESGWSTQEASRRSWAEVPEANKAAMRVAVAELIDWAFEL